MKIKIKQEDALLSNRNQYRFVIARNCGLFLTHHRPQFTRAALQIVFGQTNVRHNDETQYTGDVKTTLKNDSSGDKQTTIREISNVVHVENPTGSFV